MTPVYGITPEQIAIYLGRALTSDESTNFDVLIAAAAKRLEAILCADLGYYEGDTRNFYGSDGMGVVYTGFVSRVTGVSLNGSAVAPSDYTVHQGDASGSYLAWYDNIVFRKPLRRGDVVTVEGDFGLKEIPADLGLVLARMFDLRNSEVSGASRVKSKKVEDFSITYENGSMIDQLIADNAATISAYSQCGGGAIRSGTVRKGCR